MGLEIKIAPDAQPEDTAQDVMRLIGMAQASRPGEPIRFAITGIEPQRSLDQNALMWVMIRQIAKALGAKEQVTKNMLLLEKYKPEGGCWSELIGNRDIPYLPETKKFSKRQMQAFLKSIEQYAQNNGIHLSSPPGYEEFMQ
mgnify:CR=1 FL=1